MLVEINANNYKSFVSENKYTLILFKTPRCRICSSLIPILEQLEEELNFQLKIGVVDVSINEDLMNHLHLTSIPTLIFNAENINERKTGLHSLKELLEWTNQFMM